MTTELATTQQPTTALSVTTDYWTPSQLAALRHMGVDEDVTEADLTVFHHVCARTQLDPFMRQIHMVGRPERQRDGSYRTKYTIQTGIDGFRVIGRRSAGNHLAIGAPEWAHEDGSWRPVWRHDWGYPVAARVTITRNGDPHTAVALWDEYKQTKRDGAVNRMWATRPAGQLAKCAEALAWRMACPYDLAGLYTDEEMGQAANEAPADRPQSAIAAVMAAPAEPDVPTGPVFLDPRSTLGRAMFAALGDIGVTDKAGRLAYVSDVAGRPIASSADMTEAEARAVIDAAKADAVPVSGEVLPDPTDGADPWATS